jgi:two-component system sensor histidine kinase TtrS
VKKPLSKLPLHWVLLILLSCCLISIPLHATADEVRIGVLAKRGYDKSLEKWSATAEYLNQRLPHHQFRVVPMKFDDIPVIVKNQLVDFVIVNPGIYVNLSVKYGVRRILTLINELSSTASITRFGSVIFTHINNQSIEYLPDLANHRVAAVHHTSLGGWIMALRAIRSAKIETWDLASLSFLGTHDAVVEAVLKEEVDVGIVRTDTLERMAQEGILDMSKLRVIDPRRHEGFPYAVSTSLYPEWPFAQLSHTPQQLAKEVSIALLQLPSDHPATKQAHIKGWTIPENYQTVRDLMMLLELPPFEQPFGQQLNHSLISYWYWYLPLTLASLFMIGMSFRIMRLNRSLSEHRKNLKQTQEAQIATFEQAAVGLAHITLSGRLLDMNKRLCAITGHSLKKLKQTNLNEIVHKDDLAQVTQTINQLRRDPQQSVSAQFRLLSASGAIKWCQLTLSSKPNHNVGDDYVVAVIDDISPYKALEDEKQHAMLQTEQILNMAGEGILGLDLAGRHTFVNPKAASLLGYEVSELLHKESHHMWHHSYGDGRHYPVEECPITSVLITGHSQRLEHEVFWRKDGTAVPMTCISTPILIDGEINGAVVLFHPSNPESSSDTESCAVTSP